MHDKVYNDITQDKNCMIYSEKKQQNYLNYKRIILLRKVRTCLLRTEHFQLTPFLQYYIKLNISFFVVVIFSLKNQTIV
jgi:hypothetical protein